MSDYTEMDVELDGGEKYYNVTYGHFVVFYLNHPQPEILAVTDLASSIRGIFGTTNLHTLIVMPSIRPEQQSGSYMIGNLSSEACLNPHLFLYTDKIFRGTWLEVNSEQFDETCAQLQLTQVEPL